MPVETRRVFDPSLGLTPHRETFVLLERIFEALRRSLALESRSHEIEGGRACAKPRQSQSVSTRPEGSGVPNDVNVDP